MFTWTSSTWYVSCKSNLKKTSFDDPESLTPNRSVVYSQGLESLGIAKLRLNNIHSAFYGEIDLSTLQQSWN